MDKFGLVWIGLNKFGWVSEARETLIVTHGHTDIQTGEASTRDAMHLKSWTYCLIPHCGDFFFFHWLEFWKKYLNHKLNHDVSCWSQNNADPLSLFLAKNMPNDKYS